MPSGATTGIASRPALRRRHVEAQHVGPVVGVGVAQHDGVDVGQATWRCSVGHRPRAGVEPQRGAAAADQVAAARPARAGVRAAAAEDGERSAPTSTGSTSSISGPSSRRPRRRNQSTSPDDSQRCCRRPARRAACQAVVLEQRPDLERRLVGRGDQHHVAAHHVADRAGEERVVRAAEQQRVDAGPAHRVEQPLGQHPHLVAVDLVPLDELDEPGAGGAGERAPTGRSPATAPLVGARRRSSRPCRSRRPARCGWRRPAPGRRARSTPITGTGQLVPQHVEGGGRRRVARHDHELHAVLGDQARR